MTASPVVFPTLGILSVAVAGAITTSAAQPEALYDLHVIFDNSLAAGSCYRSSGNAVAPSRLDLVDNRFPVESNHFVSPPNSLRLKWTSASGGDWWMKLRPRKPNERRPHFEGDTLSFWCFSEEGLSHEQSPRMALQDSSDIGSGTITLLDDGQTLPPGKWVRMNMPIARFKPLFGRTEDFEFDPHRLATIWFVQGLDDGRPHTLYIDDVQMFASNQLAGDIPAAPKGLAVKGAERHFDVSWEANAETNLLKYQIYR